MGEGEGEREDKEEGRGRREREEESLVEGRMRALGRFGKRRVPYFFEKKIF